MLLFNAMGICKELAAVCYFNTSHVIIQQRKIILKKSEEQISIHPMLLFSFIQTMVIQLMYHISIHPMLLFSRNRITDTNSSQSNFNTSYVIIQPTKNRHSCILLISINHNLKPFFQHFTNHSIENHLFVKNHVFTPFDRLFQKITW